MIYINDDAKREFAGANSLLHVVCSHLEFEAAKYLAQLRLIEASETVAILEIDISNILDVTQICSNVNDLFQRKDGMPSCSIIDRDNNFISCLATHPSDLKNLL